MGWFFGFKQHLIINDKGEILSFYLSKGNVDDRNAKTITTMTKISSKNCLETKAIYQKH
jgi:hypothetical protein